jgi:hypothetical protein
MSKMAEGEWCAGRGLAAKSAVNTSKMPGILCLKEILLPTLKGVYHPLGLGENIPIVTGASSDSLRALIPSANKWTIVRVSYSMGFSPKE